MSGGVSVLCWLAAPVAMFCGNLSKFGNKVKIGNNEILEILENTHVYHTLVVTLNLSCSELP